VPKHTNGQSYLFRPFEDMLLLLAKGYICTQKKLDWPPFTLFVGNKRFVSVCSAYAYNFFDSEPGQKNNRSWFILHPLHSLRSVFLQFNVFHPFLGLMNGNLLRACSEHFERHVHMLSMNCTRSLSVRVHSQCECSWPQTWPTKCLRKQLAFLPSGLASFPLADNTRFLRQQLAF